MQAHKQSPYVKLLAMTVLSFIAMFILMYAMVDRFANVYPNIDQTYMAALMASPMVIIELLLMWGMYPSRTANLSILAASVAVLLASWILIREQAAVGDRQFLKSMIPHHAGAILMCGKAPIQDAAIKELCRKIIDGQNIEIEQMKALLAKVKE